jgi:hypothetical protein
MPSASFYGRLDGDAYFKTAMTAPKPYRNKSYFIHPSVRSHRLAASVAVLMQFPAKTSPYSPGVRPVSGVS